MKISVKRQDGLFHFVGETPSGVSVQMDGSEAIGGTNAGVRPMEMLLYGIAGCSGIDMVSILNKQKQTVRDIQINVNAEREQDKIPALFTDIHVEFVLWGDLSAEKVAKALDLTFSKYCSVAITLGKTAAITYSYQINP